MFQSKLFKGIAVAAASVAMMFGTTVAAHADPTVDTSGVNLAQDPSASIIAKSVLVDETSVSFAIHSSLDRLNFNDISVVATDDSGSQTFTFLPEVESPNDAGNFTIYLDASTANAQLPDLTSFNSIKVNLTLALDSVLSPAFGASLPKGLTLGRTEIWYDNASKTTVYGEVTNTTKNPMLFTVSNAVFNNKPATIDQTVWAIPAGETRGYYLAQVAGDYSTGLTAAPLTMSLKALKVSTFTKASATMAKGLKLLPTTIVDAYEFTSGIQPCLLVKNTSTKDLTVKSVVGFTNNGAKVKTSGYDVVFIPAGEVRCVSGNQSTTAVFKTDIRSGRKITYSITSSVVPTNSFSSTIALPTGFAISNHSDFQYDTKTKKTSVSLVITAPAGFTDDLKLSNLTLNGKALPSSLVAGVSQFGDDFRTFDLGSLSGDFRYGTKFKLGGVATTSAPANYTMNVVEPAPTGIYCYLQSQQLWDYNDATNTTYVVFQCVNQSKAAATADLSGVTATYNPESGTAVDGVSQNTVITIAPGVYKNVRAAAISGDARTGGGVVALDGAITWK